MPQPALNEVEGNATPDGVDAEPVPEPFGHGLVAHHVRGREDALHGAPSRDPAPRPKPPGDAASRAAHGFQGRKEGWGGR